MHTDADEKHQQVKASEDTEQDATIQHPTKDTPEKTTSTESERLHTSPTSTDEVIMPTKRSEFCECSLTAGNYLLSQTDTNC